MTGAHDWEGGGGHKTVNGWFTIEANRSLLEYTTGRAAEGGGGHKTDSD